jgi:large subunit ribosomal protein L20
MRIKRGFKARRRRNKVLKRASGYVSLRGRAYTIAVETNDRAMVYEYRDRRQKKRQFRSLWTQRINAAARLHGTTYSRFMGALRKSGLDLNRKVLADMAVMDAAGFSAVVKKIMPSIQIQ